MRSLYELAISSAIKIGANISDLPEAIQDEVKHYKMYPFPLKFEDRYDGDSAISFANIVKYPLKDDDLWQLAQPHYVKGFLTQFEQENATRKVWMCICKSMIDFFTKNNLSKKQKAQLFKDFYKFIYKNCGVLNGSIQNEDDAKFINTIKKKHLELVAEEEWHYFDNDDRRLCSELWGVNAFVMSKKRNWGEIHNQLAEKSLLINKVFPITLDNMWVDNIGFPYNISNSNYWRWVLKGVRLGTLDVDQWEEQCVDEDDWGISVLVHEGEFEGSWRFVENGDDWIWYYNDVEIFRQTLKDNLVVEYDRTVEPPHDIWNNPYWYRVLDHVRSSGDLQHWLYNYRQNRFGYWDAVWWYNGERVYEEGYCDYRGYYSHDFTTGIIRIEAGTNIDENFYEAEIKYVRNSPLLFINSEH